MKLGIKPENLSAVANLMNIFLADEFLLYVKTKNAHWNIEGPDFFEKHKFFEEHFEKLDRIIDALAERIRTIGHFAPATLKRFLQLTHLSEVTDPKTDSKGFEKELLGDHESIIIHYRSAIKQFADKYNDQGSSDFITGIMEQHEKMAWMLSEQLK